MNARLVPPGDRSDPSRPAAPRTAPEDDAHLQVMRLLEERPTLSQRELSLALGLSLGKVNYCLRALMDRGWVKANNFRRSNNKMAYAYVLTPRGLREKLALTRRFLAAKEAEFERLRITIDGLRAELGQPLAASLARLDTDAPETQP
jgi:EPS-associated MarR family transcriptional regulator